MPVGAEKDFEEALRIWRRGLPRAQGRAEARRTPQKHGRRRRGWLRAEPEQQRGGDGGDHGGYHRAGYEPGEDVRTATDPAAAELYEAKKEQRIRLEVEEREDTPAEMVDY